MEYVCFSIGAVSTGSMFDAKSDEAAIGADWLSVSIPQPCDEQAAFFCPNTHQVSSALPQIRF